MERAMEGGKDGRMEREGEGERHPGVIFLSSPDKWTPRINHHITNSSWCDSTCNSSSLFLVIFGVVRLLNF